MNEIPVEWAPVIATAWLDNEFHTKLKYNPTDAFKDFGLKYDGGIPFDVPARPLKLDMSDWGKENSIVPNGTCTFSAMVYRDNVQISGEVLRELNDDNIYVYLDSNNINRPTVLSSHKIQSGSTVLTPNIQNIHVKSTI